METENDKLIITTKNDHEESTYTVRVNRKSLALVSDIASRTGRSRAYIASKLIEYAYDHVVIEDSDSDECEEG